MNRQIIVYLADLWIEYKHDMGEGATAEGFLDRLVAYSTRAA